MKIHMQMDRRVKNKVIKDKRKNDAFEWVHGLLYLHSDVERGQI